MEIIEIKVAGDWTADDDVEDFVARFGEARNMQKSAIKEVESAYMELHDALAKALQYFLKQTPAEHCIAVGAMTVAEKCSYLSKCVFRAGREPEYGERFKEHLDAVLHYDGQRGLVMARHWANPDHAWLIELADLADCISSSCHEFDEAMCCEHDDYESAIT